MCGRLIMPGHASGLSEVQTQLEGRCVKSLVWPALACPQGGAPAGLPAPRACRVLALALDPG
jgi:hypothetical protein